jgi:hypothetical protein
MIRQEKDRKPVVYAALIYRVKLVYLLQNAPPPVE